MTLGEWLDQNRMTQEAFAGLVGVDQSTITRLVHRDGKKQTRKPGWGLVAKIAEVTGGAVTANDWVDGQDEAPPPSDQAA